MYVDPTVGGIALQAILGGASGILVLLGILLRRFWHKVRHPRSRHDA